MATQPVGWGEQDHVWKVVIHRFNSHKQDYVSVSAVEVIKPVAS